MVESKEYNVYIDESGDEGINKGSKFFILTAIIVDKEKDLEISKSQTIDFVNSLIYGLIKVRKFYFSIFFIKSFALSGCSS